MIRKAFLSFLLVAGLILTSCGGATPAPAPKPTPTPAPAPTPAPTPAPAPTTPPAGIDAAKLYATNCAACHGVNRQGTPGLAPALTATALAGKSEDTLIATVTKGKPGTAMAPFEGRLTKDEIHALVDFVRK